MNLRPHQLRRAYVLALVLFLVSVLTITGYALWRLRAVAATR
jgi:hypothetical protein